MPDSLNLTRQQFAQLEKKLERAMRRANKKCAERVLGEMKELVSLSDHTEADLAALGHPYRRGAAPNQPHEDFLVHTQSGELIEGLSLEAGPGGSIISDGIVSTADHTLDLIFGTRTMRPRDFVSEALTRTEAERAAIINQAIQSVLKSIK